MEVAKTASKTSSILQNSGVSRVSFALVIDGYDLFIVSFFAPLIAGIIHLSFASFGTVFAAGLAGSMVGACFWVTSLTSWPPADCAGLARHGWGRNSAAPGLYSVRRLPLPYRSARDFSPRLSRRGISRKQRRGRRCSSAIHSARSRQRVTALFIAHGWRVLFLARDPSRSRRVIPARRLTLRMLHPRLTCPL